MFKIETCVRKRRCGLCKNPILKGEEIVLANLGTGYYDIAYHIDEFVHTFRDVIKELHSLIEKSDN